MLLKLVEYHWAESIEDALLLLARLDTRTVPLAGGTYLLGLQDDSIQAVVDLRDLELAYVSEDTRYLHIGAMTTLQNIADEPLLKEFATGLLARAAVVSSSSRLIRNCATLGGTVATGNPSQADLLTALVALEAEVVVRSGSKTQVNLSGGTAERPGLALSGVIYKGKQERRLPCGTCYVDRRPNELILELLVPCPATSCGTSFTRIGRTPTDAALLNAAAVVEIEDGVYRRVRLAMGGVNMEPARLRSVERQLEGQSATQFQDSERLRAVLRMGMNDFRPPDDARVSSGYRRVSGPNLAYRVLEEATNVSLWRGMVSSGKSV
ncbi:MAG: FAD binding domain-containing protein [Ktedonobacteraceae bacterium]|nr:FAD binding domain-containing protein [Ktedonobacteraceae bacterium]